MKTRSIGAALLSLSLALAACAPDGVADDPTPSPEPAATTGADPTATPEPMSTPSPDADATDATSSPGGDPYSGPGDY